MRSTGVVHDFCEHIAGNAKKQDHGGKGGKGILMDTVSIDQKQVALRENGIFSEYLLVKFSPDYLAKFQVIMGMKLSLHAAA